MDCVVNIGLHASEWDVCWPNCAGIALAAEGQACQFYTSHMDPWLSPDADGQLDSSGLYWCYYPYV